MSTTHNPSRCLVCRPRPWRIRKVNRPDETSRWLLSRRSQDTGVYQPVLSAPSFTHVIRLMNTLIAAADRYSSSRWSGLGR